MRCGTERDSASLRLHDPFDEVKPQTVTGNIRAHVFSSIERLEELLLIRIIDSRTVVGHADLHGAGSSILVGREFDLGFIAARSVFECVAEQILQALTHRAGIRLQGRKICIDVRRQFALFQVDRGGEIRYGAIDHFVDIDRLELILLSSGLSFRIEENLFHHFRQAPCFLLNDLGVLLDSLFVADHTAAQIVCRRTNDCQGRAKFVRHAGGKFHLKLTERVRALTRYDDGDETGAEHQKHSKTDRQIPDAQVFDGIFQRPRSVLHH